MRVVRLIFAVLAIAYVVGQVFQERKRLAQIQRMSGPQAVAFNEQHRERTVRILSILTVVMCLASAGTLIYALAYTPSGS